MNLSNSLLTLRSIRNYTEKKVHLEQIGDILDTARYAPSSGNLQNWKFIIVRDSKKREEICHACLAQYWMALAPIYIVVCCEKDKVKQFYGKRAELFAIQNCAIVSHAIMLKAHELGLGTCWVGMFEPKTVSRILNIPENVEPQVIITLGYPEKSKIDPGKPNRLDLDYLTFFEEFGLSKIDTTLWPIIKYTDKIKSWFKKNFRK